MIAKRIEVRLNKLQETQFLKDIDNVSFIKNEYLAYNELIYEQYRLGNSDIKHVSAYDFMKLFNNEILNLNPRLRFVKESNTNTIKKAVQQKEQAFLRCFKKTGGFPKYIKKRDRIKQGIFLMYADTKQTWKRETSKVLYLANTFFPSSKRCSRCGSLKEDLKLQDRVYSCSCGSIIDRDLNAAINLSVLPSGMTGI